MRKAQRLAPDGTPRPAASHLGLFYLPMSLKSNARLNASGWMACSDISLIKKKDLILLFQKRVNH